jgi:hypothetical protein
MFDGPARAMQKIALTVGNSLSKSLTYGVRGCDYDWNTHRMYFAGNVTAACFRSTSRRRMCQTKIK